MRGLVKMNWRSSIKTDRQRPELRKMTFGCERDNRIDIKERKGNIDKKIEQGCENKR